MTSITLLGLLTLGIVFIAMLMVLFALVVPTQNKLANRLIAAYLLILAITISVFFYHQHYTPPLVIEKLRDRHQSVICAHLLPFCTIVVVPGFQVALAASLARWHFPPGHRHILPSLLRCSGSNSKRVFPGLLSHWETYAAMIIGHLQAVGYLILVFIVLARYRKVLQENYADNGSETHKWLWQMNVLLSVLFFSPPSKTFQTLG